jgi:predicted glycogen debranching enzyme
VVVLWTPVDGRRVTPVPPGHWLVLKDEHPFRAGICVPSATRVSRGQLDACTTLYLESVPVQGGHIAVVPPSFHADVTRGGHMETPATVSLVRFGETVSRLEAALVLLADRPVFSGEFDVTSPASETATVLLTNGRGGMARMAVDLGKVFSKYDCLLGANLHAELPVDRHVFAKRLRAWINVDGFITALDLQNLAAFKPGPPAVWTFRAHAGDEHTVEVQFTADMVEGQNTVVLRFSRRPGIPARQVGAGNGEPSTPKAEGSGELAGQGCPAHVRLTLRVDLEDRSFHSQTEHNGGAEQHFRKNLHPLEGRPGFAFTPAKDRFIRVYADTGAYFQGEEWSSCGHPVEATRGQVGHGDAFSPGWFDLPLDAADGATLVLTAEAADPSPETCHQAGTMREADDRVFIERAGVADDDSLGRQLALASRAFVVRRGVGKSVIAGYPWFLDWGRDTLIAARGLLAGGAFQTVTELLITFGRFVENGTLPNTIHGDNASNRDTSDAPLWYGVVAEETAAFIRETAGEREAARFYAEHVDEKGRTIADVLREIAAGYLNGTPNGIRVDPASALVWSPSHFTWMDTNFPAGTPRAGYPVEIQALWIRLLKQLDRLKAKPTGEPWATLAERARIKVEELFWVQTKGWFADCLIGPSGKPAADCVVDEVLRSNMLFLVSLGLFSGDKARRSVEAARQWLVIPGSLRSLAPLPATPPHAVHGNGGQLLNDPANPYWGRYEGDEDTRRKPAYHNGTAWGWPLPTFCEALAMAYGNSPEAVAAARAYLGSVARLMNEGCLGQLPEIIDGDAPHAHRGCDAQAWSVTEALRVWKTLNPSNR